MRFTIYGIRLIDDSEVRYIGFTRFTPAQRLHRHMSGERSYGASGRPLRQWLLANAAEVEAFPICTAKTEVEARAMEKGAIAAAAHAHQRLFNSDHIPAFARSAGTAADREYRFGREGSRGATDRREVRTGHVRTHDETAPRP